MFEEGSGNWSTRLPPLLRLRSGFLLEAEVDCPAMETGSDLCHGGTLQASCAGPAVQGGVVLPVGAWPPADLKEPSVKGAEPCYPSPCP